MYRNEILVGDKIILPSVKVRHRDFIGAFEFADVEIDFKNDDELNCMLAQIFHDDGFHNL